MSEIILPPKKKRDYLDPVKEAQAVAALRESMSAIFDGDDRILMDTIEGETQLLEAFDKLLETYVVCVGQAEGLDVMVKRLQARGKRLEDSAKRVKGLIEQAMSIADLDVAKRPLATLSMSARQASLVVTEESAIPSKYWKTGDPTLDKKALTQALRDRADALAALPTEPAERAAALQERADLLAPIAGAELSNAAPTLTIRIA